MDGFSGQLELLWRVLVAMGVGGVIGFEREAADKPAGLRTHMLVAGAAALLVGIGEFAILEYDAVQVAGELRSDPIRVLEAVVTGVSFLGAGTIIRGRGDVIGLTTAASLLLAAGVGSAVALSQFVLAAGVALTALIVLRGPLSLERRLKKSKPAG